MSQGPVLNGLALCAGVGGLELGLHLALGARYRTVCYVEREAYAAGILVARMEEGWLDQAPVWDDLTTFNGGQWRGVVDLVSAGYPCQPFSSAAHGQHTHPDLFPQVIRIVEEVQPRFVFLENVARAHSVEAELESCGYATAGGIFTVESSGGPHRRARKFTLGYSNAAGKPEHALHAETPWVPTGNGPWHRLPEPIPHGMDDGMACRVDRLRACGEGVVPAVAARAWSELSYRLYEGGLPQ